MVKILLTPKSFEEQLVKKITGNWDDGIVRSILVNDRIAASRRVIVAVCNDGDHGGPGYDLAVLEKHIKMLYSGWDIDLDVDLRRFSFVGMIGSVRDVSHQDQMIQLLNDTDVFYMGGIYGNASESWKNMTRPGGRSHCLVELLRARVQYNCIAYVGVCGGAMLAGSVNYYGLTPLDLLQGLKVEYHSNCSAGSLESLQLPQTGEVHFATGGAIGICLWHTTHRVICFPCIKNGTSWVQFCERNAAAAAATLRWKVASPDRFLDDRNEFWFYSLAGYLYRGNAWLPVCEQAAYRLVTSHLHG